MNWQDAVEKSKEKTAVRIVTAPSGRPIAIINRYADGEAYQYNMMCGKITKLKPAQVEGFNDWEPRK